MMKILGMYIDKSLSTLPILENGIRKAKAAVHTLKKLYLKLKRCSTKQFHVLYQTLARSILTCENIINIGLVKKREKEIDKIDCRKTQFRIGGMRGYARPLALKLSSIDSSYTSLLRTMCSKIACNKIIQRIAPSNIRKKVLKILSAIGLPGYFQANDAKIDVTRTTTTR